MADERKPEEIKVEEEAVVVEEEGYDVNEGEGENGVSVTVTKT